MEALVGVTLNKELLYQIQPDHQPFENFQPLALGGSALQVACE